MKKQILTLTAILTASAMAAAGRSVTAHVPAPEDSVPASGVCTPQISADGRTVKKYRVKTDILQVRSGPDTSCPVIGSLTKGQKIRVLAIKHGWARVKFAGVTAYVYARYLLPPE